MMPLTPASADVRIARRAEALFLRQRRDVSIQTDQMFAALMLLQWIAGVIIALTISPRAWEGRISHIHPHVWFAVFLGGIISALPIFLALREPGRPLTRYVIAVAQMLWSGLLIHLAGGRIETHFHIFGSLAFLALYRDWRVLVPATLVIAFDHLLRGMFWPQSIYGVLTASPWRTVEHVGWVLFEDIILVLACLRQVKEMRALALRQAELQVIRAELEQRVASRTEQLRKVNGEVRLEKDRAESANRAKTAFLANMSHEIRTPMTAIVGYSDLMLEPDQTTSDRHDCLQVIRRNGTHLLDLINDILDVSKIEAGKMTIELISVDLIKLVAEVVSLMRPRALDKGLAFKVEFGQRIPKMMTTDALRLRQVLVNLLGNAIKFTETGTIRLKVSCPQSGASGRVRFDVIDTGIGISPKQAQRLFQSFTQADESTTRRFGGTGLGLNISKHLAHLLGGEITVHSEVGIGSTFTFEVDAGSLPETEMISDATESMLAITPSETALARIALHGRILFAEDGPDNQRLISTHLRRAGAEVVIADNGQIAVDLMAAEHFDLVLLDMQMPVLDGYSAATMMRKRGCGQPIIALTAHALADDRAKCLAAGCTDYLSKPIDRDKLLRVIASYLRDAASNKPCADKVAAPAAPVQRSEFADDPSMVELIAAYVSRLPAEVAKLQSLLQTNELEGLRRATHQLKGSGGGYGFAQLTTLAASAEQSIKQNAQLESIQAGVADLVKYIRTIDGYHAEKEAIDATEHVDH